MKEIKKLSHHNSKKKKIPKNYEYWSSSVFEMPSSSSLDVWWCGEGWGSRGGSGDGGGGGGCTGRRIATPHLLEVAVHGHHPLLHGLYLLHSLLLIPLVALIQLHVPPIGLLELPLHQFIQCMNLMIDGLRIGPDRPRA